MTLRTQGGKILTQGGKLSCDCCGGDWYCCEDRDCVIADIKSITMTIDAQDYLKWSSWPAPSAGHTATKLTQGVRGSAYSGAISLMPTGPAGNTGAREYRYTFPGNASTQCTNFISVLLSPAMIDFQWTYSTFVYVDTTPDAAQHRELSQLTCPYYEKLPYIRASGQDVIVREFIDFVLCQEYAWPAGKTIVGQFGLSSLFATIPPTATVDRETGSRSYTVRDIAFVV